MAKFESELQSLENNAVERLKFYEDAHQFSLDSLAEIKEWVLQNEFVDEQEEIHFFKLVKPKIYAKIIFYNKLFCLESKRIMGAVELNQELFLGEQKRIKNFFQYNSDFYQYYRSENDCFDRSYFVRGKKNIRLNLEESIFDVDHRFSTSYDLKIAKIIANEELSNYITKEITNLQNSMARRLNPYHKSNLEWTNSKTALIELIYGLHSSRVFNSGNADLKSITTFFEQNFNIDLGDIYRAYIDLKKRKNKSQFLDNMIDNLLQKMSDDDIK